MLPLCTRHLVMMTLAFFLAGCEHLLKPKPFLLRCQLEEGSLKTVRVNPRQQQVQELDPRTLDRTNTFWNSDIPDPAAQGLVDEMLVRITSQEVHWEVKRYRPQMEWETNTVDLQNLSYKGETGSFTDLEPAKLNSKGVCQKLDDVPDASTEAE